MAEPGKQMYKLLCELFPIPRSITGDGVRKTLSIIKREIPALNIHEVPSGTKCFDWVVPEEWNIRDAYIIDPVGKKILDFKENNLHIVGYSIATDKTIALNELQNHLHSLPDSPDAIPYITSYYKKRWGFCLSENQRKLLRPGDYRIVIDSDLREGSLTYGEVLIPGDTEEEIFLSTYVCHPSLANNELSGPVVTTFIVKWLTTLHNRRYSYRIVFIPETIGSITYLSRNLDVMKKNIKAGFNITCVGDDRAYSYLPSRSGDTISDLAALHVLTHMHPQFVTYSYLDRGSDERQYCSPGVDLPVCSIMRTKYGAYPEYHTSLDNLDIVTPSGLLGAYNVLIKSIECLEEDEYLKPAMLCEPQLGKRGLYPTLSTKKSADQVKNMMDFLAYADGELSNLEIAEKIGVPIWQLKETIEKLKKEGVLKSSK